MNPISQDPIRFDGERSAVVFRAPPPPPQHWSSGFYLMSDEGIRGARIDRGLKALANAKRFRALRR